MANGDINEVWRHIHEMELRLMTAIGEVAGDVKRLDDRWSDLRQRQSQIPTWLWLAITVALTVLMFMLDQIMRQP